ncbi:hypothetical protein BJX64DRAFT_295332 [Aspergillus heterothallicus]
MQNPPWLDGSNPHRKDPTIPFYNFFVDIEYLQGRYRWKDSTPSDSIEVISRVLTSLFPDKCLRTWPSEHIPMTIEGWAEKYKYGFAVDASISRIVRSITTEGDKHEMSIPLAVITAKKERGTAGIAKHEIPHLLLQLNMVFNYDQTRNEYDAFLITLERPYTYRFVRAIASAEYIRSVRGNEPVKGTLKVLRSKRFWIGPSMSDRREFLRGFIGFARALVHREEFKFPLHEI